VGSEKVVVGGRSRAIGAAWKWRWLLAANLYLLSPVLLYEFRIGEGGPEKTILFILSASVLWLAAAQLIARRVWVAHALMFPLYLVVAVDLYIIVHYRTRLSSSMLLTIFENLEDGREYLQTHGRAVFGELALVLAGYGYCLFRIRHLRVRSPRFAAVGPLFALVVVYLGVHHVLGGWMWVATNDRNSPFGIFPQAYTTDRLYLEALQDARQAQGFVFDATRVDPPSEPELYVLVIGESSRAMNWQLYGYARDTNAQLARLNDLIVFRDVVTQAAVTRRSVPLILTRGTIEDEQRTAREKSIVSVFREAGFHTYWLSTQERDPFTGAINRYPREAEATRFYERRFDGVLVDAMKQMLADGGPQRDKMFFVVHTMGSHFNETSRYPREFNVYPDDDRKVSDKARLINSYDNTIDYTDRVLSQLIDVLRERPGLKALLYIADHGENLRDDERDLFGHYLNNEYDLPIPMLFWYSDEFALRFPDKMAAARANAARPLNTRVVFHSLADMAGIDIHDPETPRLSVFSPRLGAIQRMVMGEPKPFDYDRTFNASRTERHGALAPR
jgi:glucan phosphoethanolaminetransferase (alkaline phosphatase superfamily)